ncbi:hypothetical protein ACHQM5_012273 [Ranunculus cassubicifolius]
MACCYTFPFPPRYHHLQPQTSATQPFRLPPLKLPPKILHYRLSYRFTRDDAFEETNDPSSNNDIFEEAVVLFNTRNFYKCHDYLESLWNRAEEPQRTLIHGILQCAVGFHHLFGQNHRGAMMELGEGLCKLKKMNFVSGPFWEFQKEIGDVLEFVYQTQLELAACTDDICLRMDGSERSYQLLGSFAAGQHLYHLESSSDGISYIAFYPEYGSGKPTTTKVKVPTLNASKDHLIACDYF